jgi:hypothetical protein
MNIGETAAETLSIPSAFPGTRRELAAVYRQCMKHRGTLNGDVVELSGAAHLTRGFHDVYSCRPL